MTHFVYILECADKTLYTGCTNNIDRRLKEHNNSKSGAHYTKIRRPVIIKYREELDSLSLARRREAEIKKFNASQKRKLCKVWYNVSNINI